MLLIRLDEVFDGEGPRVDWTDEVDHLAQHVLEQNRLLADAGHSMQLRAIEVPHLLRGDATVSIQIATCEPASKSKEEISYEACRYTGIYTTAIV